MPTSIKISGTSDISRDLKYLAMKLNILKRFVRKYQAAFFPVDGKKLPFSTADG